MIWNHGDGSDLFEGGDGTDTAEVAVFSDRVTATTIVVCAIDNLGKGAAGQAVQNANVVLGVDETAGLRLSGVLV